VVFDAGRPAEKEEGGRIYEVGPAQGQGAGAALTQLRFGYGDIDYSRVHIGDRLWKTNDPELDKRLRQSFAGETPRFQRPIELEVHGGAGLRLTLIARDQSGHVVRVESSMPLAKAEKAPLSDEKLREQFGRLGGTPFKLGTLKNFLAGEVLLPVSELNRLRREAVAGLERLLTEPRRWKLDEPRRHPVGEVIAASPGIDSSHAELIVLIRSLGPARSRLEMRRRPRCIASSKIRKKYREAVINVCTPLTWLCQSATGPISAALAAAFLSLPRAFSNRARNGFWNRCVPANADGYLVRNYDHLKFFAGTRRVGDFSLNVANRLAADYFQKSI
jgi:putative protease